MQTFWVAIVPDAHSVVSKDFLSSYIRVVKCLGELFGPMVLVSSSLLFELHLLSSSFGRREREREAVFGKASWGILTRMRKKKKENKNRQKGKVEERGDSWLGWAEGRKEA